MSRQSKLLKVFKAGLFVTLFFLICTVVLPVLGFVGGKGLISILSTFMTSFSLTVYLYRLSHRKHKIHRVLRYSLFMAVIFFVGLAASIATTLSSQTLQENKWPILSVVGTILIFLLSISKTSSLLRLKNSNRVFGIISQITLVIMIAVLSFSFINLCLAPAGSVADLGSLVMLFLMFAVTAIVQLLILFLLHLFSKRV